MKFCLAISVLLMTACTGIPNGISPVNNFNLSRYLGTWYEIARLDHGFERGLSNVKATYSMNPDGSVKVINTGFSEKTQAWKEAIGKARFVGDTSTGYLKVSFFGPFYGAYIIFKLGKDYQYAFITSYNKDFLWLLARTPTVSEALRNDFIKTAKAAGFDTENIIFVTQDATDR